MHIAYYLEPERNLWDTYTLPETNSKFAPDNGCLEIGIQKNTWKGSMAQLPCIGLSYPLTNRHQKLGVRHLLSVRSSPWKCYTKWSPIISDFQVIGEAGNVEKWKIRGFPWFVVSCFLWIIFVNFVRSGISKITHKSGFNLVLFFSLIVPRVYPICLISEVLFFVEEKQRWTSWGGI